MIRTLILAAGAALALAAPAAAQDLAALEQRIRKGEIQGVHGLIVMKGGRTLAEHYFEGRDEKRGFPLGEVKFAPDTLHDVRSVTKSIVGLLVGVAVAEGAIKDLDAPALDYFPEYTDLNTPERRRVTLRHLLTMTSGLHWDEETYPYTDRRNSEIAMDLAPDPYRYVLSQSFDAAPGHRFKYSGGDVAVMAAILARATKTPLEAYAQKKLFGPLGIGRTEWIKDAKGVPYAASGLRMTPRDMAKIGQLVLANGRWNGRQVVPAAWVRDTLSGKTQVQPDPKCGLRYANFWWLYQGCELSPPTPYAQGNGNGGQRITVVPDRELVVVITAGLYNSPRGAATANAIMTAVMAATK